MSRSTPPPGSGGRAPPAAPGAKDGQASAAPNKRGARPRVVAEDMKRLLAWQYLGRDLLDKLRLVTDNDNTMARLLWAYALDGPAVLSADERAFLGLDGHVRDHQKPWGRLTERLVDVVNDPEIQADDDVYRVADLFVRLASLAERAGTSAVVARALDLAQSQRGAASTTRASGDDNRARVESAWRADIEAGSPERGRAARCARRLKLPETTVKSVVLRLRALGRLPPAGR